MADKKISQLPDGTPAVDTDVVPIERLDGTTYKVTAESIADLAPSAAVSSVFGRTGAIVATTNDYSEAQISFTDITTNNVSTSKHGYTPKLPGDATKFLDGTGAFSTPSGGGGGSPLTNVVTVPQFTGTNIYGSSGGFSTFTRIYSPLLILNPTTWKFAVTTQTGIGIVGCVVYRTLVGSLTVVDSTTVQFGGLSTGIVLPTGKTFSDSIALALDMSHDYYIVIYWDGAFPSATVNNYTAPANTPVPLGGFLNSNQLAISTIPTPGSLSSPQECTLTQMVALS